MAKSKQNKPIEPVYLDQDGYNELLAEIERLRGELNKNGQRRREALENGARNGDDSPEFEIIGLQERLILGNLKDLYAKLNRVVIIEKHNEEDVIDIGDIVTIDMMFTEEDSEELMVKIVVGKPNLEKEIKEITINSPLGKALYQKQVGEQTSYLVNNTEFKVVIKSKTKALGR